MTQLILYTSEDGGTVVKESLTTQTGSGLAAFSHFRSATKMVVRSKARMAVNSAWIRGFSTHCVEKLEEVPT